jgi:hypothetical protein
VTSLNSSGCCIPTGIAISTYIEYITNKVFLCHVAFCSIMNVSLKDTILSTQTAAHVDAALNLLRTILSAVCVLDLRSARKFSPRALTHQKAIFAMNLNSLSSQQIVFSLEKPRSTDLELLNRSCTF